MVEQAAKNAAERQGAPVALLLCTDLFFGLRLQKMAQAAGFRPVTWKPGSTGSDLEPRILVVDLAVQGDWEEAIREAVARGALAVAFGPHIDGEARKRAKGAGASRVLSNSNLARDLPGILLALKDSSHAVPDGPGEDNQAGVAGNLAGS